MNKGTTGNRYLPAESVEWLNQRLERMNIASYVEFAELVGIDRGTIFRYFRHERRPSIDVIAPLCEALQISPLTLLIVLGAVERKI